jgi:hypothetical protein
LSNSFSTITSLSLTFFSSLPASPEAASSESLCLFSSFVSTS